VGIYFLLCHFSKIVILKKDILNKLVSAGITVDYAMWR